MGDNSKISWTEATWNPVIGCKRVSPGCDHCYAFQLHDQRYIAWKRGRMPDAPAQYHKPFSQIQLMEDRLDQPLHWRKPRRIFVNSLSDLFHEDVPEKFIARLFAVMAVARQHTYQVLTKRPERMERVVGEEWFVDMVAEALKPLVAKHDLGPFYIDFIRRVWPLPNVWLGTSVEDQERAKERIPRLIRTPAAIRFLSCEPLLGPIDLKRAAWSGDGPRIIITPEQALTGRWGHHVLDWVIVGGESGPHYREMDLDWARQIRDDCLAAGVAFFYKQSSGRRSGMNPTLDGVEWHQYPEIQNDQGLS